MLLDHETLGGIARGDIQLVFRRWKRPTVRSGGTLLTGAGQLQIGEVSREAIRDHPGLRAADLSRLVGQERGAFRANVRKLKNLGLTISLEVGYRLSPRGAAYLGTLTD